MWCGRRRRRRRGRDLHALCVRYLRHSLQVAYSIDYTALHRTSGCTAVRSIKQSYTHLSQLAHAQGHIRRDDDDVSRVMSAMSEPRR